MHYQTFLQKRCSSLYFPRGWETAHFLTWLLMLGINSFLKNLCRSAGLVDTTFLFAFISLVRPHIFMYALYIYLLSFMICLFCALFVFLKKSTEKSIGKNDITFISLLPRMNKCLHFIIFCFLVLILGN